MKFIMSLILLGLLVFPCLSAAGAGTPVPNNSAISGWTMRISGVIQHGRNRWTNWYTVIPPGPDPVGSVSASNGTQDFSLGFDALLNYRISDRFVLGVAAGFVPTRLHAEVHHTEENGIVIEKPKASISFCPVRICAGYDLLRWAGWSLQVGLQCGLGIFGSQDVRPAVGKARHFYGGARMLLGVHIGITRTPASGWGYSVMLQQLRTSFMVEELGSGELRQKLNFNPISLLVGIQYSFKK